MAQYFSLDSCLYWTIVEWLAKRCYVTKHRTKITNIRLKNKWLTVKELYPARRLSSKNGFCVFFVVNWIGSKDSIVGSALKILHTWFHSTVSLFLYIRLERKATGRITSFISCRKKAYLYCLSLRTVEGIEYIEDYSMIMSIPYDTIRYVPYHMADIFLITTYATAKISIKLSVLDKPKD